MACRGQELQLRGWHPNPALQPLCRSFFDTTKTGEITSRLSADTTTVSDQICLNLNVMLRSATQVRGWRGWAGFRGLLSIHPIDAPSKCCVEKHWTPTHLHTVPHLQAAMVLVFMFSASWRLTVVTFGAPASGAWSLAALCLWATYAGHLSDAC